MTFEPPKPQPLVDPQLEPSTSRRRTLRSVMWVGLVLLACTPLAIVAGSPGLAGLFALTSVVVFVTTLVLQRGIERDPWRAKKPAELEDVVEIGDQLFDSPPHLGPPLPPAPLNLPIGPGRSGADAAEDLLRGDDHDAR